MSAPLIDALVGAGFDPEAAQSRARLMRLAGDRLAEAGRSDPFGAWFVPGRLELVGKHTDYAGGRSVTAAVPRGIAVVAAARTDGRVRVLDARYGGEVVLDPGDPTPAFSAWRNYVAVVSRRLASNFPGAALGTDIAIASDLPKAAGVSSSSALIIGVAQALIARGDLPARPEWQASIPDTFSLAGYLGAVENGLTFRGLAGTGGVGTEGGSQDHTAILASRPGYVRAYGYAPVRPVAEAPMPHEWQCVVMTSGVHAGKASDVRDQYNRASRAVVALVDLWTRAGRPAAPTLAAVLASGPGAADELRAIVRGARVDGFHSDELLRRLAHFEGEDRRAVDAVEAVRKRDAAALGEIMRASQQAADTELGNQVDETRALARSALAAGALAATSFGAGFGGSVWALIEGDREVAASLATRWAAAYGRACPHLPSVEWFLVRPAPAATALGPVLDGQAPVD